ncbi:MAG: hypothetical protein Q7U97_10640 [Rhodocyclaceae bacterium]|nr:hypothetical protein [Rhodocyclaceae bacterium]
MKILLVVLFGFFSNHVFAQDADASFDPPTLSAAVAARYAIYAMVSSNAYHNPDRKTFAVEKLGWVQVDGNGKKTGSPTRIRKSGLAYDIFEKQDSNEVIFAFRGTDSKEDYLTANLAIWPFSLQYTQAKKYFAAYLKSHPEKKVTVTGHSLGGGLALSMSVRYGVDAVVFDSSPRIFDGLGDKHLPASRILVYEGGEILAVARKVWRKIFEAVPRENIYKASFDFGGANRHRSDHLARGLLELGATVDSTLVPVLEAMAK